MYCSKCGMQNDSNSKFCTNCGNVLESKVEVVDEKRLKSINTMSIVAFVFSFLLAPVGLILSIIGLVRCNKYKKETNQKVNNSVFNIVGIIVSAFITFILFILAIVFTSLYLVFKGQDDILKSTWECRNNPYFGNYAVTAKFNKKDFIWAKYGVEEDNQLRGNYSIINREYTNGKNEYTIKFEPNYYIANGKESNNYTKSINMSISFDETTAIITSENSTKYYCERK